MPSWTSTPPRRTPWPPTSTTPMPWAYWAGFGSWGGRCAPSWRWSWAGTRAPRPSTRSTSRTELSADPRPPGKPVRRDPPPAPSSDLPPPQSSLRLPMSDTRLNALRNLLEKRPDDPRALFGLALEHLNRGETESGVVHLRRYLEVTDDEGNAWGRLAEALEELGHTDEALEAWRTGIAASERHGHPTMAEEFREELRERGEEP
ncbi:MAG: hypothetical protein EA352_08730 [Gemmatimonadales bacterium]|nr:MAG: hypothetical protein EA352_08730 [Gemmatimonadales bacterium]